MLPKATKRKLETTTSGGDDPWGTTDEQPTRKGRISKTALGEYDEDPGRRASKQFQSWGEWQTKFNDKEKNDKRQFVTTLNASAEIHRKEIGSLLIKSGEELNAVGDKYTKFLRDAYAVKNAAFKGTSAEDAHETQQKPSLFKTGQQLLQVCHDLVISHEEADRKVSERNSEITDRLEQIRAHWSSDMVQLDEILQFGFDYGVKIVECSVSPSTSDEKKSQILTPDRRSFREAGQTVLDMYQKSTEKLSVVPTWGEEVKNYTEKMLAVVAVSEKLD